MCCTRRLRAAIGMALAGALGGCDQSPAAPSPTPGGSPGVQAVRLEIDGPRTIAPGVTSRFTATLHLSDGTRRDVTSEAVWSSAAFILAVTQGVVTPRGTGTDSLRASASSFTSTKEVIVVPPGTYRLTGTISDPVAPSGPVEEARIEVTDGVGRGLLSFTPIDGRYALHGVAGDIVLRVTKQGYERRDQPVTVTDHQVLDLDLPVVGRVPDVSGSYVLTITAADTCGATLPPEAMSRSYAAVVAQVGPTFTASLSGAEFGRINSRAANLLRGRVEPNRIALDLGELGCFDYYYGCGASLIERLSASRSFVPTGRVSLSISPTRLTGELDGAIEVHRGETNPFTREASCSSSRHRVVFSR